MSERAAGPSVTSRALALLGSFDAEHRRLTLTEMASRADVPLSTAHRLVGELQEWGAVERRPDGAYVVGRRLWDVGLLAPLQSGLREAASPFLSDVHAATRATVHLAVREGTEVLYVERLTGTASVPIVSRVGSRLPLHCTGVGKVLLAHAPEPVLAAAMEHLVRMTPYTVTQPRILADQLERARRQGYATTAEEMTLGAGSIAVPVLRGGEVVAALGVVVADTRRGRAGLVAALRVASQGVTRTLERP
jgi:DNA-binding IclR family transcriptional regulator